MSVTIRDATREDLPVILGFIRELADYEHLLDDLEADEENLAAALFSPSPRVFSLIAERDGAPVGHALWFYSFSTFRGRHGIWLEDLFVRPEERGRGAGRALLAALAQRCVREGLTRLEWSVLTWNEPSIRFYEALGAVSLGDWAINRLAGAPLAALADEARGV